MRELLLKLILFFSLLLLIKCAFVGFYGDSFVYQDPRAIGNQYEVEYRRAELAKEKYDTVFIGSSRTALGISPSYFDFLTKNTKSYNFGIISGTPPETFDWCEDLIQTEPSLKHVFFELGGGFVGKEARGNAADKWMLTFFKPTVPRIEYENIYRGRSLPMQNIPLEKFLEKKSVAAAESRTFSLPAVERVRLRNIAVEKEEISAAAARFDEAYWERVSRLVKLAETKQIRLYFFIPPRLNSDSELELISPIYLKLNEKYKLRAAHYDESLYRPDSSLDNTHLNHHGAKRFTELLAKAFNIKIKE